MIKRYSWLTFIFLNIAFLSIFVNLAQCSDIEEGSVKAEKTISCKLLKTSNALLRAEMAKWHQNCKSYAKMAEDLTVTPGDLTLSITSPTIRNFINKRTKTSPKTLKLFKMKFPEIDIYDTLKVNASNLNITDDRIAEKIAPFSPLTVSEAWEKISQKLTKKKKSNIRVDLDLSSNTICDEGAEVLSEKISKLKLRKLDLSWNRVTDEGIETLIKKLQAVLEDPFFESLDISGNYGANKKNIESIVKSQDILKKIIY